MIRIPRNALIAIIAIALISTVAVATTVSVVTTTYQAEGGVQYVVTGYITAVGNGFQVAPLAATATGTPVAWTAGGTANTGLTAGDWEYSVTLTLTTKTLASTTYTLTVQQTTSDTALAGIGPTYAISFTTPASITATSMTFYFDTGSGTFTVPMGIVITVG